MRHLLRLAQRRTIGWAVVLAALAVGLCRLPLFNVLGYEFSFAVAIVASFAAADLGAAQLCRAPRAPLLAHVFAGWVRMLVLLGVPLAMVLANGLFVRPCDNRGGLLFYLLLPCLSVLFGTVSGVVAATLVGARPWLGGMLAWLTVLGSLVLGVVRFYAAPPIFGYDPFAGYFPGALYDEHIRVLPALYWSRLYQALWAAAALFLAEFRRDRRPGAAAGAALTTLGALLFLYRSADFGFHVSASDMAAALGGRRETPHFIIYFPAGAPFSPEMDAIAEDHELRYAHVVRAFGVAPGKQPEKKIVSFYFANAADKGRWMGAESSYIAKPWRREIYLSHESFPHGSLRHEIAHVVAGEFGDPLFHVSVAWWVWPPAQFNVGLIEGAAVAADWPAGQTLTPHQSVRAMLDLGLLPPLSRTLATSFFDFSSAQSYTTAGSFCYFLIQRHGVERFRELYRSGGTLADFPRLYGKTLDALEREWRAEVETAPLTDRDRAIARERFRHKAIFYRPCPHAVGALRARADAAAQKGDAKRALLLWERVCAEDPEPSHRLVLAARLERAGRVDEAERVLSALAADEELGTPLRARAALALVDLRMRRGDLDDARRALDAAASLPVDENIARNLDIRRLALSDTPGAAALREYLLAADGGDDDKPDDLLARARRVAEVTDIGRYLIGRVLWLRGDHAAAAKALAEAAADRPSLPLVRREIDRLLLPAAYLAGDLAEVEAAARRLSGDDQPPALRLWAQDWLERVQFHRTGTLLLNR